MCSFSQDYPKIEKDSLGNNIFVMTIEQAQQIDNNLELLELLKISSSQCDSLNISYLKIIDNIGKQILLQDLDIKKLKEQILDKDDQIVNLQLRLSNMNEINKLCEEQKSKDDQIISLLKKDIRKQKIQKIIGFGVGAIGVIGVTLMYLGVL